MTIQALKPAAVSTDAKPQVSPGNGAGEADNAASFGQTLARQRASDSRHAAEQSANAGHHHPRQTKNDAHHAAQPGKAATEHGRKAQAATSQQNPHGNTGQTDAGHGGHGTDHLIRHRLTGRGYDTHPQTQAEDTAAPNTGTADQTAPSKSTAPATAAADNAASHEQKASAGKSDPQHAATHTAQAGTDDKAHAKHPNQQAAADTPPGAAALIAQAPVVARDAAPAKAVATTARGKADASNRDGVLAALRQRDAAATADAAKAAVKSAQTTAATTAATLQHNSDGNHKNSFGHMLAASADAGSTSASPVAVHSLPTAAAAPAGGTAAAAAAPQSLTAPLGSEAWAQALGQQSLRLSHNGGTAELTLYPRDLGQLQVSLTLGQQQQAQLHFVSPHADVRAAVEAALPQLRQAFVANGLVLGDASVSDNGQQQSQQSSRNPRRQASNSVSGIPEGGLAPSPTVSTLIGRSLSGGIDIFA